jgi:hypothetical protein
MKSFEVWVEGYRATGESSTAQKLGTFKAISFDQAVDQWLDTKSSDEVQRYYQHHPDREQKHTWWGCDLFDNETEARKSFG